MTLATLAQMWTGGERLEQVGDRVSMDIVSRAFGYGGMFVDSDLSDAFYGAEIRFTPSELGISELLPGRGAVVFNWEDLVYHEPGVQDNEPRRLQVEVTAVDASTISLLATLSSEYFVTHTLGVTIPGTHAYFGPSAYVGARLRDDGALNGLVTHDNLTFESATTTGVRGDLDLDGDIDQDDLLLALANFTGGNTGPARTLADGDLDGDGDIDNVDIGYYLGEVPGPLSSLTTATLTAVPEPTSLAMLTAAGLIALRQRR